MKCYWIYQTSCDSHCHFDNLLKPELPPPSIFHGLDFIPLDYNVQPRGANLGSLIRYTKLKGKLLINKNIDDS